MLYRSNLAYKILQLVERPPLDVKMDFQSVAQAGSMLGSGGVTVMEEGTSAYETVRGWSHELGCGPHPAWCYHDEEPFGGQFQGGNGPMSSGGRSSA